MDKPLQSLPPGTQVDDYEVEATLGGGGFGVVYLARELATNRRVVIKEYMPGKLARRVEGWTVIPEAGAQAELFHRGLMMFLQEAKILATLKHPSIVNVINFFRANGTVYTAMEYEAGKNLRDYIGARGGQLSESFLRTVFPALLDGLKLIHSRGYLHLDIKPGNIHIRPGGRPLLLDFGAVHRLHQSRRVQPGRVVTPDFAPIEQCEPDGYVGPWSDIYAVGATMRTCIEGRPPPPSTERREKDTMRPAVQCFKKRYSHGILQAIDQAMEVDPLLRPQSVDEFLEALKPATAEVTPPPGNNPEPGGEGAS